MSHSSEPTEPGPSTHASKVLAAAVEVEGMVPELTNIVIAMRANPRDIDEAYRMLYEFRKSLGSQIAKLGFGKPARRREYPIDGPDAR